MAIPTPAANRIVLKPPVRYEEDIAGGSIYPGNLLRIANNAGTRNVYTHNVAGGYSERAFAVENSLEGLSLTDASAGGLPDSTRLQYFTPYVATNLVPYVLASHGAVIQALLKGGTNYAIGDKLISDGSGMLQKDTTDSTVINKDVVAEIYDAIDLSASAGALGLGVVRIL